MMNQFKFCGVGNGEKLGISNGEFLLVSDREVEAILPKALWREGCYYWRRWPRPFLEWRKSIVHLSWSPRSARLTRFDGKWYADFPHTHMIDWGRHVDQGEKYWAAIAVLPRDYFNVKVQREYDYWKSYREIMRTWRQAKRQRRRLQIPLGSRNGLLNFGCARESLPTLKDVEPTNPN